MKQWLDEVIAEGRRLAEAGEYDDLLPLMEDAARADDLTPDEQTTVTINLAWTLAHSGQPERAIDIITSLIDGIDADDLTMAYTWGTLGCAYVLAARHEDALEVLTDALAARLAVDPWVVSAQLFYRGEALYALGRLEEARRAWGRTHQSDAGGLFGQQAQARLRNWRNGPYR